MKELTIEEKAKRYDEALKVAKKNYEAIVQMEGDCSFAKEGIINTFHHMFPELEESEDEKIRKHLFEFFKKRKDDGDTDETWYGISYDRILAWLEKQGEQSTDNDIKEALHTEYEKGRADAMAEVQKSAWSEEDDYVNDKLVNTVALFNPTSSIFEKLPKEQFIERLKFLKYRIQSQSQWNPSDEDKLRVKQAIMYLSKKLSFESEKDDYNFREGQIKWLKSIKERLNSI